ncbi:MAG: DUF6768 family protein [Acidimicrobiales bacterium]
MSDFGAFVRESLVGSPGLGPGPEEESLDDRVAILDVRMKTVRSILWLGVTVMAVVAVAMIVLLVGADSTTDTKWLVLYGSVFVAAMLAIAMVKLWHFHMQADTANLKEILRLQAMVVGGTSPNSP